MASTTNIIDTTLGSGLSTSVSTVFSSHPFLSQIFNEDVKKCAIDNMLGDCSNPPSLTQIDNDIVKADNILEFIVANEVFDKDTKIFQYQTIINFLKVKKCINGQYPCWADKQYQENLAYLNDFDFTTS